MPIPRAVEVSSSSSLDVASELDEGSGDRSAIAAGIVGWFISSFELLSTRSDSLSLSSYSSWLLLAWLASRDE